MAALETPLKHWCLLFYEVLVVPLVKNLGRWGNEEDVVGSTESWPSLPVTRASGRDVQQQPVTGLAVLPGTSPFLSEMEAGLHFVPWENGHRMEKYFSSVTSLLFSGILHLRTVLF